MSSFCSSAGGGPNALATAAASRTCHSFSPASPLRPSAVLLTPLSNLPSDKPSFGCPADYARFQGLLSVTDLSGTSSPAGTLDWVADLGQFSGKVPVTIFTQIAADPEKRFRAGTEYLKYTHMPSSYLRGMPGFTESITATLQMLFRYLSIMGLRYDVALDFEDRRVARL
ncbi:hypothetical protein NMY22_g7452 [Coprinellus aureogranulatus]|nr:hypothetical protein NMY22_g7452 [Coprinellus aureogranulatus]